MACTHTHIGNSTCVNICDGGDKTYHRTMRRCPCCQRLRPIAGFYQRWYGFTWTCLGCGDSWSGGELLPRPFARGWRQRSIANARRMWDQAGS
jgi:ribosomal protein L37AE/L43A